MKKKEIETLSDRQYRAIVTVIENLGERVCDVLANARWGEDGQGREIVYAPLHGGDVLTCTLAGDVVLT